MKRPDGCLLNRQAWTLRSPGTPTAFSLAVSFGGVGETAFARCGPSSSRFIVTVVAAMEPAVVALAAEFTASLRELRRAAGQPSIERLAEAAGFSTTTVSDALRGPRRPTRRLVQALAAVLGADPDQWGERWDALDWAVQEARGFRLGPDGTRLCQVEGCEGKPLKRWCGTHRRHYQLYGDPLAGRFSPKSHPAGCSVEGCDRPYRSLGFCELHYGRHRSALAKAATSTTSEGPPSARRGSGGASPS